MQYKVYTPTQALRPFIERLYILSHEGNLPPGAELSSPANCYSAIVLNYGDRYRLETTAASPVLLPVSFIAGQSTMAYRLHLAGRVNMLGIVFNGTALQAFFPRIPLVDLIDRRYDLTDLIGREADYLLEQVADASTDADRFALVEAYLLDRWQRVQAPMTVGDAAGRLILRHRGMLGMDSLADTLNVSPRHLRRVFSQQMGMSPKLFARLKRFNYVHAMLASNPTLKWQDFLADGGFYDQSHFIRDFVLFSGKAPSAAIQRQRQMVESLEV